MNESGKYYCSWKLLAGIQQNQPEWAYSIRIVIGPDGNSILGQRLVLNLNSIYRPDAGAKCDKSSNTGSSAAAQLAKISQPTLVNICRLDPETIQYFARFDATGGGRRF